MHKRCVYFGGPLENIPQGNQFPELHVINRCSQFWEAMHFPVLNLFGILCPGGSQTPYVPLDVTGENGPVDGKEITSSKYLKCRLLQHNKDSFLHKSGCLLEHYFLQMFLRIQDEQLFYLQCKVKSALQNGDPLAKIYLADTKLGGRAFQRKNAQNALAVAQRLGMPTLFITLTCNPSAEELKPYFDKENGMTVNDRYDLIIQYFHGQVLLLRSLLEQGHFFGRKPAYILQVIEFTQRVAALPHNRMFRRARVLRGRYRFVRVRGISEGFDARAESAYYQNHDS